MARRLTQRAALKVPFGLTLCLWCCDSHSSFLCCKHSLYCVIASLRKLAGKWPKKMFQSVSSANPTLNLVKTLTWWMWWSHYVVAVHCTLWMGCKVSERAVQWGSNLSPVCSWLAQHMQYALLCLIFYQTACGISCSSCNVKWNTFLKYA